MSVATLGAAVPVSRGVNLNHLFENDELHRFHMERDA